MVRVLSGSVNDWAARVRRLVLVLVGGYLLGLVLLAARPVLSLQEAEGLYRQQETATYHWTSSQVRLPLHGRTGPTQVALTLGLVRWPGDTPRQVTLATDAGVLARFEVAAKRQYHVVVPSSAPALVIRSSVERPPRDDSRWLGVVLFDATASAHGLPLQLSAQVLLLTALALALVLFAMWLTRRGYGLIGALTAGAFALRVVYLDGSPPGFNQDEVVSLVDAWFLLQTARDHWGHVLPLGAQEALGDWIPPLLTYLELPLVALLGPVPLAGRLTTAAIGTVAVPISYYTIRLLQLPLAAAVCAALVTAISPWQIFLSRFAIPPALVPTAWALCIWAALLFVQRAGRADATRLAIVAGLALYAYPTMKLAVPLLVGWAVLIALLHHDRSWWPRWVAPLLLLALLW
ncbi:MAG: hypothetical protein H7Z42_02925, partial [Roseiflexaceae bacterium]|nr:hypothetical protein [Roseiflexaceae bacterium]